MNLSGQFSGKPFSILLLPNPSAPRRFSLAFPFASAISAALGPASSSGERLPDPLAAIPKGEPIQGSVDGASPNLPGRAGRAGHGEKTPRPQHAEEQDSATLFKTTLTFAKGGGGWRDASAMNALLGMPKAELNPGTIPEPQPPRLLPVSIGHARHDYL